MNRSHLPRALIILLFILVIVAFFVGTLRTFASARAASVLDDFTQRTNQPSAGEVLAPTSTSTSVIPPLGPTPTPLPTSVLPPATKVATPMSTPAPTFTPTPIPEPEEYITDMTGIISLAILLVVVILVGVAWGGRNSRKKKEPKN
jgi:hypothetical protein